jgi:hypothetical protein
VYPALQRLCILDVHHDIDVTQHADARERQIELAYPY